MFIHRHIHITTETDVNCSVNAFLHVVFQGYLSVSILINLSHPPLSSDCTISMYRNLTKHPLVNRKVVVSFCHYNVIMNPVHVSCYTSSSCLQFLKVELQSQRDIYQILIVPKCPSKGYIQLLTNHHQMSQLVFLTSHQYWY